MKNASTLLVALLVLCATVPAIGQWEQTNGPWTGLSIYDFEIDNGRVYVATDHGVYASEDKAESWYSLNLERLPHVVKDIEMTDSHLFAAGESNRFYRYSFDRREWDTMRLYLESIPLGASITFEYANQTLYMLVYGENIYATKDEGITWDTILVPNSNRDVLVEYEGDLYTTNSDRHILRLDTNDYTWDVLATAPSDIQSLSFITPAPGVIQLYVGGTPGLFRMDNFDGEWHELRKSNEWYTVHSMVFNSEDGVTYAIINQGINHSFDGGDRWHGTADFFVSNLAISVCYLDGALLAGTDGHGIYKSTDHGISWKRTVDGITNSRINALEYVNERMFAGVGVHGAKETGLYTSTDGGGTWQGLEPEIHIGEITTLAHIDTVLVGTSRIYGLFRSDDYGYTWRDILAGMRFGPVLANDQFFFVSGPDRVYASGNRGITWHPPDNTLTRNNPGQVAIVDHSVYLHVNPGFYQTTYRSYDNGATWEPISLGTLGTVLTVKGNPENNIFILINDQIIVSSDNGASWYKFPKIFETLPSHFQCAFYTKGNLIVGTTKGIYRATLDNRQWVDISDGIGHTYTTCFGSNEDSLFVGTLYKGVWSRSFEDFIVVDSEEPVSPPTFHLAQNYPNPIHSGSGATIDYSLSKSGYVTLKVYSILGREIATVLQGEMHAGTHSASLPTSSLPPGMYIYRLAAGDKTAERIMLVQ